MTQSLLYVLYQGYLALVDVDELDNVAALALTLLDQLFVYLLQALALNQVVPESCLSIWDSFCLALNGLSC